MATEVTVHRPPSTEGFPDTDPVIFLAGPIKGGPEWQTDVTGRLWSDLPDGPRWHIASPRRTEIDKDFDYDKQVDWETVHLFRAMDLGLSIFWLARQDPDIEYPPDRAYAQTTRFEFGMIFNERYRHRPTTRISLGIEPGYKGNEKYYRKRARDLAIPVHKTLEDLVADTVEQLATLL